MIELFPMLHKMDISEIMVEFEDNYKILNDFVFVFEVPKKFIDVELEYIDLLFSATIAHGFARVEVNEGLIVDGLTLCPDFETLLAWSIIHDVLVWASQETGDSTYESIGDEVCSEIGEAQGASWLTRTIVETTVEEYDSYKNDPTYHN